MHGFQMILGRWSLTVLLVGMVTSFWAWQLEKRARYQVRGENPAHSEGTGREWNSFQFIRRTKPLLGPPLFWHLHSQQFRYNAPQPQPCKQYIYIYIFCWTNSLVRHWLLISGWTRWQHLRSITRFLSRRSWYDSCWAEAPKVGIARCSTSASEPEAFPKGLKSLCFSVNRIPNTWTAFSCSRIVLGESPKLSQAALCCLISVCHAKDLTQPLEWSCHLVWSLQHNA